MDSSLLHDLLALLEQGFARCSHLEIDRVGWDVVEQGVALVSLLDESQRVVFFKLGRHVLRQQWLGITKDLWLCAWSETRLCPRQLVSTALHSVLQCSFRPRGYDNEIRFNHALNRDQHGAGASAVQIQPHPPFCPPLHLVQQWRLHL